MLAKAPFGVLRRGAEEAASLSGKVALVTGSTSGIGRNMDDNDQRKTAEALESSPNDCSTTWRNPGTGQIYSVTPTHTYPSPSDRCRDFMTVTEIDGREEVVHGTACRQPDGTWKPLSTHESF